MPTVRVVVPHYGSDVLLERCMDALRAQEADAKALGLRVEVRSPNSNPPRRRMLFTDAINHGLTDGGVPRDGWVWLLNNDCYPQAGCLRAAMECFMQAERCGIVGCQNRDAAEPDRIVWGGSLGCYPNGMHKSGRASLGQLQARTEEHWATFASVLIRVEVLQTIGLLDANLRHVYSDSDYCLRAKAAGWRIYHEPKATVLHDQGTSSRTSMQTAWLRQVMYEDQRVFHLKWFRGLLNLQEPGANLPPSRRDPRG